VSGRRLARNIALVATVILASAAAGQVPDWQPLAPGSAWTYDSASGTRCWVAVEGGAEIRGRDTVTLREVIGSWPRQVVRNYWSRDFAGNVYLHGARNEDGFAADYEPPILWVAASLSLGQTWGGTFDLHWPEGGGVEPGNTCTFRVDWEEDLATPAGSFHSFGISWAFEGEPKFTAPAGAYSVTGVRLVTDVTAARWSYGRSWYSDGVGQPRICIAFDDPFDLIAFTIPVPAAIGTWGAVKQLYRD